MLAAVWRARLRTLAAMLFNSATQQAQRKNQAGLMAGKPLNKETFIAERTKVLSEKGDESGEMRKSLPMMFDFLDRNHDGVLDHNELAF
ncbi:uncharacterized protein EV422DRAFT_545174 [Fimicolochytrium jonesii]|uniref:uncharacterized protein n=1 Tax=Fimicolochytrium jonesii TaxID=1396493 RepID=UPI0022FDBF1C|nr:uncharacterized protein EV422DRAFT_545174 [Fimicolochytrium jonesii]KAI8816650.1 hypothetical protein EV422DRAFT_545174 [Fimicolochytrium jonesii]